MHLADPGPGDGGEEGDAGGEDGAEGGDNREY